MSRRVRIRVVVMEPAAKVAYAAVVAAIRSYVQKVMEQELHEAVPFGPV